MLNQDGIQVIKFWLSITKDEQSRRLNAIKDDPLESWKLSGLDQQALKLWKSYTLYKEKMLQQTDLPFCKWMILDANYAPDARIEAIKYVLSQVPYPKDEKALKLLKPSKNLLSKVGK